MIKINIVIDLRAKFEEVPYIDYTKKKKMMIDEEREPT